MGHYLEGHSTSPRVMIPATRAFHQTARPGGHGLRSHRLRSLLMQCKYCRTRVNYERLRSGLVVFVVAAPPDAVLVAPLGGAVKPLVHAPEAVHPPRISRIGVVDDTVLQRERAQARPV